MPTPNKKLPCVQKQLCVRLPPSLPVLIIFPLLSAVHSSATNRLIEAKDKAAVQINIGHVNGALRSSTLQPYART